MSSPLPLQQALSANKLLVGAKLTAQASHTAPQKTKPLGRTSYRPHHSFWLGISSVASQHRCPARLQAHGSTAVMGDASSSAVASPGLFALLIIGPGVLGAYLGKLWADCNQDDTVTGQTNSRTNHPRLQQLGLVPRLKQEAGDDQFANVVFCAPPSGCEDYEAEIQSALRLWDGSGTFLFTSSAGVFTVDDGSSCNEDSPVHSVGDSDRTDRLLKAEQAVLEAGGCVVRLAGLYHADRGPHTFFLKMGQVPRWPGYTVNLVHYEDAASLCHAILKHERSSKPFRRRVFVGTDGAPLTFQRMMDATVASGQYQGQAELTGREGESKGKLLCNDATREAVGWTPKYTSFEDFMSAGAQDFYKSSELF